MLIMSQNGSMIVNMDNVTSITIDRERREIVCNYPFTDKTVK